MKWAFWIATEGQGATVDVGCWDDWGDEGATDEGGFLDCHCRARCHSQSGLLGNLGKELLWEYGVKG